MKLLRSKPQFVSFAPIDLKDAIVRLRDGWGNQSAVSAVTNSAEEPASETTIALTNCGANVPVGTTVHFSNDSTDTEYVVASRATSGGTNAIFQLFLDTATGGTFTLTFKGATTNTIAFNATAPTMVLELEALDTVGNGDVAIASASDWDITFQDDLGSTVLTVTDFTLNGGSLVGAGSETLTLTTPGVPDNATTSIVLSAGLAEVVEISGDVTFTGQVLEVKVGEGNLNFKETRSRKYIRDRGNIDTIRDGEDEPMEVTFDFVWDYITAVTGSGIPTIEDALKQIGEASAWVSTSTDTCEPYCVNIEVYYDPACAGVNNEKAELPYFRYETLDHNLADSQISCAGKCNATMAILTRATEELP